MIEASSSAVSAVVEAAFRYYDELGWYVVPVRKGTRASTVGWKRKWYKKRPLRKTTARYFSDYPDENVGLITGTRSNGTIVIDFDDPKAYEQFLAFLRIHDYPTSSLVVDSGRRGYHVYFHCDFPVSTAHANLGFPFWPHREKIDLLGEGGLCVIPPSRHHSDELNYEWLRSPLVSGIPAVPNCLMPFIEAHRVGNSPKAVTAAPKSVNSSSSSSSSSYYMCYQNCNYISYRQLRNTYLQLRDEEYTDTRESFDWAGLEEYDQSLQSPTLRKRRQPVRLDNKLMSFEENTKVKLQSLMKRAIPLSMSNNHWIRYGFALVEFFDDADILAWFGKVDESQGISKQKAAERIREVGARILATRKEAENGKRFRSRLQVEFRHFTNPRVVDAICEALSVAVKREKIRLQAAKVAAYFLDCQSAAEAVGMDSFYRGFEYMLVDIRQDPVFSCYTEKSLKKQLSMIMPFVVAGFRVGKDGIDLNVVPIINCLYKAKPISKGEARDTKSSEYCLDHSFRWLLEIGA